MDLVYVVKEGDKNPELRYSLRSVEKNLQYDKIWIVGYKPNWITGVEYIPVIQDKKDKWHNSDNNLLEACKNELVSDDFILMNDDFICLETNKNYLFNYSLGKLNTSILKHMKKTTNRPYNRAFSDLKILLSELGIKSKDMYDYESHTPMIINKHKFLELWEKEPVKKYLGTDKVLHKRSLYKNVFPDRETIILPEDVKIQYESELDRKKNVCGWISFYDEQVDNIVYYNINLLLQNNFPNKSKYESDDYIGIDIPKRDIINKSKIIIMPDGSRKII